MTKPKAIQIPLSEKMRQRCPELFVWIESQENPNEATRKVLEHFISLYGTESVDSENVKIGMAKDLLSAKGMLQGDVPKGISSIAPLKLQEIEKEEHTENKLSEDTVIVEQPGNESENAIIETKKPTDEEKKPTRRNMNVEKWT